MKLLSDWWKRLEFWAHWESRLFEPVPLISFSLDFYIGEIKPLAYFATNDTNRWKLCCCNLRLSRYWIHFSIPYKKLPDFTPSSKAMLRTRKLQAEHAAQQKEKYGSEKV